MTDYNKTNSIFKNQNTERIGYVTLSISLYFLFMPFDLFALNRIGTLLRMLALLPVITIFLNYDKCTFNSREALPIVVYAIYKLISIVYSSYPTFTYREAPRVAVNLLLVVLIGSLYHLNSRELYFLKYTLAISGIIMIFLLFLFADFSGGGRLTIRTSSGEVDQNALIGYLLYIIPFFIEQVFEKKRYLGLIPILIVYVVTIMTGSRGGLLSALAATTISLYGVLKDNWEKIRKSILQILASISAAMISFVFSLKYMNPEVLERFSLGYVEQNGTTGRKDIWIYFIKLFSNSTLFRKLFGYGTGVSSFMNRMNTRMAGHVAHNLWVDELITGGIIGLILLTLIHTVIMMTSIKCKDIYTTSAFLGFLIMCANLSILSYKPMWNCMILIMLINKNRMAQLKYGVEQK